MSACVRLTKFIFLTSLPSQDVNITFVGNRALLSGAAIFASDLQVCSWIGTDYPKYITTIFGEQPQEIEDLSPFHYKLVVISYSKWVFNCDLLGIATYSSIEKNFNAQSAWFWITLRSLISM